MIVVKPNLLTKFRSPREVFRDEMGDAFPGDHLGFSTGDLLDRKVPFEHRPLNPRIAGQAHTDKIEINLRYAFKNLMAPDRRRALHGHEMIHIQQFAQSSDTNIRIELLDPTHNAEILFSKKNQPRREYQLVMLQHYGIHLGRVLLSAPDAYSPEKIARELSLIRTDHFRESEAPGKAKHAYYVNAVELESRLHTVMAYAMRYAGKPMESIGELYAGLIACGLTPPPSIAESLRTDESFRRTVSGFFGTDSWKEVRKAFKRLGNSDIGSDSNLHLFDTLLSDDQREHLWRDVFPATAANIYRHYGVENGEVLFDTAHLRREALLIEGILTAAPRKVEAAFALCNNRYDVLLLANTPCFHTPRQSMLEAAIDTCNKTDESPEFLQDAVAIADFLVQSGADVHSVSGKPVFTRSYYSFLSQQARTDCPAAATIRERYRAENFTGGIGMYADARSSLGHGTFQHYLLAHDMVKAVSSSLHKADTDTQEMLAVLLSVVGCDFDTSRNFDIPHELPQIHELVFYAVSIAPKHLVETFYSQLRFIGSELGVMTSEYFDLYAKVHQNATMREVSEAWGETQRSFNQTTRMYHDNEE